MDARQPDLLERNRSRFLVVLVMLMAFALLLPGTPPTLNGLTWQEPSPGLRFGATAQALSESPIYSMTGAMTVELWLAPGFSTGAANQEMLSLYDDGYVRPLLLGQSPNGYL